MATAKQQLPKFGLALDWETSGATWGGDSSIDYQGISFGAIIFDTATLLPVKKLYQVVKFDDTKYTWSMDAQRIHGLTPEFLAENGVDQEDAAAALVELILEFVGPGGKVLFMGHNREFDRRFTNQLTQSIGIEFSVEKTTDAQGWIQLHHVVLDTSGIGLIAMGLYKSDLLFSSVGLEDRAEHNALTDAEYTLETCRIIRMLVNSGLGLDV